MSSQDMGYLLKELLMIGVIGKVMMSCSRYFFAQFKGYQL